MSELKCERINRESRVAGINEESNTVFLFNIPYHTPLSSLQSLFSKYGEVMCVRPFIENKGQCFITFYDIRDSKRFVYDFHDGYQFNGKTLFANFSFSKRDISLREVNVSHFLLSSDVKITVSDVQSVMSKFGDISSISHISKSVFCVLYFNIKHANLARENGASIMINGVRLIVSKSFEQKQSAERKSVNTGRESSFVPPSFAYTSTNMTTVPTAYSPLSLTEFRGAVQSPCVNQYSQRFNRLNFLGTLIPAN